MKEVIMKFEPGSKMQMHCYKHNGKIHRTWDEIIVIEDTKDYIVCANNKVNITESDGRSHKTKETAIIYLYKKRWFHITSKYKKIECTLYEQNNDIIKKIDSYNYKGEKLITLDNFLKNTVIIKDEYSRTCREYKKNSLYLEINAVLEDEKIITHKIPLILDDNCIK